MKRVLITGGSSGIGEALVKLLSNDYEVIFTYFKKEDRALEIQEKYNCQAYYLDLGNKNSILDLVSNIGKIDYLINNAGIAIDNDVNLKTYEEFKRVIDVNLTGTYYLTKTLLKKINVGGSVVFVTSTNGIDTVYPESIDYDASKAGIISLVHNFSRVLAPNIRVNAVAPGWVDTPMNATLEEDFKRNEIERIMLERFAKPEEVASVIKFLISDEASYVNDSIIRVDGGIK